MQNNFFISEFSIFAPGLETKEDLKLFADSKKSIAQEKSSPKLEYTDALFRRRLSQLSKMTVEVVHNLIEKFKNDDGTFCEDFDLNTKIIFTSFRGEIEREFKLNKSLIEDCDILPASFSLSVFNAPIALATMSCGLKAGYNVVFANDENFKNAFSCAAAPVIAGLQEKILFVYGDELIPTEYDKIKSVMQTKNQKPPVAFAALISKSKINKISCKEYSLDEISSNVYDFIKSHIKKTIL